MVGIDCVRVVGVALQNVCGCSPPFGVVVVVVEVFVVVIAGFGVGEGVDGVQGSVLRVFVWPRRLSHPCRRRVSTW